MGDIMDTETKLPQTPETTAARTGVSGSRIRAWRATVVLVVALAISMALVAKFPNLRGNLGYLALVALTPLLVGAVIGLSRPVLGRSLPSGVTLTLWFSLALCLVLDFGFFVLVGFIRTEVQDSAP